MRQYSCIRTSYVITFENCENFHYIKILQDYSSSFGHIYTEDMIHKQIVAMS